MSEQESSQKTSGDPEGYATSPCSVFEGDGATDHATSFGLSARRAPLPSSPVLWCNEHGFGSIKHRCPYCCLQNAYEFLQQLRGEWKWKKGERAGNAEEYEELEKTIETLNQMIAGEI